MLSRRQSIPHFGDCADLDHSLSKWQQRMDQKRAIFTSGILKYKAQELRVTLQHVDNIKEPK